MPDIMNDTVVTNDPVINRINRVISFLILLFLASLSNSIFLNQIGYYGALLLLLYKWYYLKKSPFEKTGLEIPFILFIAAEVISAVLSQDSPAAFHNVLKRVLLIPVVYTMASSSDEAGKLKFFFRFYLGFAVFSAAIYLGFSFRYFIYSLYQTDQSGPMVFHYPITTSEILSFSLLFIFAFLVNEKADIKKRLFYLFCLAVTGAALLATYKRTGWIGTGAGVLTILLIKKQYKLLGALSLAVIAAFIIDTNASKVIIYDISGEAHKSAEFKTPGRASDILPLGDGRFLLSDYENGIQVYKGSRNIAHAAMPAPVTEVRRLNDTLFAAALIDTRFVIFTMKPEGSIKKLNEFASPGFTTSYSFSGRTLYVADKDSGITVFTDILNPSVKSRFPEQKNITAIFADSTHMIISDRKEMLSVYALDENLLPSGKPAVVRTGAAIVNLMYLNKVLWVFQGNGIIRYAVEGGSLRSMNHIAFEKRAVLVRPSGSALLVSDHEGSIYRLNDNGIVRIAVPGFVPASVAEDSSDLYVSFVKRSRLRSIFDPYIPSNYVRVSLWKAGLKMFSEHPVFGVGDIDLAAQYKAHKSYYEKEIQGHLHNNYFHFLAILGGFGFLAVMFLIGRIILLKIKIIRTFKDEPFMSSYAMGALGCFISFLVAGLTEWNFGDHEVITMVWFVLGLDIALFRVYKKQRSSN